MTLVYAKIMGMFVYGAEPGGRGWGWRGKGGCLKVFISNCRRHMAVGKDGGLWGWGNDGGGAMRVVGKGVGRGFKSKF